MAIGPNNVIKISEMPTAPADAGGALIIPVVYRKTNYSISLERVVSLIDKTALGLGNVDNVRDMDKPVSSAMLTALGTKADRLHSHGVADISGLQTALDNLQDQVGSVASADHVHTASKITDFKTEVQKLIPNQSVVAGTMQW